MTADSRRVGVSYGPERTWMETRMPAVEHDMNTITAPENLDPVTFIDSWLDDNALWLDV